ncbi:CRISPR-associated endonuclease Cas9 [Lentibacillus sp. JNUCC-1]|uniref:hypothetical protein n=1 Tax=Lentibacillus sp. JNUCC-1 TaxID=2654513 RepID=UPI00132B675C|nr:hypothetical protein [Lentibacillus sp. JNUCC-1]MUV38382.1 CRISPR-associated endonuclease Cas9 [Lentibacillus sp. JNUCC-1]
MKIEDTTNRAFELDNNTVAANGSIARTEVFRHKETRKFYLAPVYVSEVMAGVRPSKFITANKPFDKWINITEEYEFLYSLFPNDIIKIKMPREKTSKTHTKEQFTWTEGIFYYKGVDTGTAAIKIIDHKDSFEDRVGTNGLKLFDKFQVDPLGNLTKVNKEKSYVV